MNHQVKQQLKVSYNRNARLRDTSEMQGWKTNEMNMFYSYIRQPEPIKLLDLGAGAGHHGKYFSDKGLRVTCADLSPNMVQICREKGLEAVELDFYTLDLEEGSFDAVWAMNCLLHVPKDDLLMVLRNIRRVLKPGGYFYMGVYGGQDSEGIWEQDIYEPKRFFASYEHEAIQKKVSEIFEIVRFAVVPMEGSGPDYQSLILRNTQ